jgi:hypothetical protein
MQPAVWNVQVCRDLGRDRSGKHSIMRRVTSLNRVLMLGVILTGSLGGCGQVKQTDQPEAGRARSEAKRQKAACASSAAYVRLKGLLFDQAVLQHEGSRANLDTLADYTVARMEDPVVQGWDPELDVTRCGGRLILELPPGAERGFGGERCLQADIDYTAQATADGAGYAYKLSGADPIVAKLAAFNLTSGGFRPPAAIDERESGFEVAGSGNPDRDGQSSSATEVPATAEMPPQPRALERGGGLQAPGPSPALSAGNVGEGTIRAFYAALGAGDGASASGQMIPEKRSSAAFSPGAMSRFYGQLSEPIRLTRMESLGRGAYRVSYQYSAGRSRGDGSAIVTVTHRNGGDLIRSIRALNGC